MGVPTSIVNSHFFSAGIRPLELDRYFIFVRNDLRQKGKSEVDTGRRNRGADIDHRLPNVGCLIPPFLSPFAVS